MFILKVLYALLGNLVIFGGLLFLPAWTLNWERAWIFLGVVAVSVIATMIIAFRENEELWNERLKPPIQPGQPLVDKIIMVTIPTRRGFDTSYCPMSGKNSSQATTSVTNQIPISSTG